MGPKPRRPWVSIKVQFKINLLTPSFIMLKITKHVYTARFEKYIWPFFNIMNARVKYYLDFLYSFSCCAIKSTEKAVLGL